MKKEAFALLLALFFVAAPKAEAATGGRTQSEAVAWVNGQIGAAMDYDGVAGVQCVDLIKAYYNCLGQGNPSGNAYDYMNNWIPDGWTRLTNEQTSPQPGDVMVYDKYAYGALEYGHVGMIAEVTSQGYQYVDFNGMGNHDPGTLRPAGGYKPLHEFSCVIRPDWTGGATEPPEEERFAWDEASKTLTIRNVGNPANEHWGLRIWLLPQFIQHLDS